MLRHVGIGVSQSDSENLHYAAGAVELVGGLATPGSGIYFHGILVVQYVEPNVFLVFEEKRTILKSLHLLAAGIAQVTLVAPLVIFIIIKYSNDVVPLWRIYCIFL